MTKRSRSRSRSRVRIPIRKGEKLRQYGYELHASPQKRHLALRKAAKQYGALSVFRKLNALATLTKNVNKSNSRKYRRDRDYVKKQFMTGQ